MPFKVEVIADSSGHWCSNNRLFPTREEAEEYGRDLARRWTLVQEWRVVETEAAAQEPLRSPADTTVIIGPIMRVYCAVCTTAPPAFDAGSCITIATGPAGTIEGLLGDDVLSNDKHAPARVVLVEVGSLAWQRARYASGLFASALPDPMLYGPPEIAAELLRRLDRGTPTEI